MPEQQTTPPELHETLVRVGGDVDLLEDLELVEMGVSRDHALRYAWFLAALTPALPTAGACGM